MNSLFNFDQKSFRKVLNSTLIVAIASIVVASMAFVNAIVAGSITSFFFSVFLVTLSYTSSKLFEKLDDAYVTFIRFETITKDADIALLWALNEHFLKQLSPKTMKKLIYIAMVVGVAILIYQFFFSEEKEEKEVDEDFDHFFDGSFHGTQSNDNLDLNLFVIHKEKEQA